MGVLAPFPRLAVRELPGGLPYAMTLAEFWHVRGEDYLEQGPRVSAPGPPRGPALDVGDEDAGQLLLCLDGAWVMGGYH
jgi:hypothetical protein